MSADPTHVTPARKNRAAVARVITTWHTARLYACGHEVTTNDSESLPADACPKCGAERNARYPDVRQRRAVPAETA